MIIKSKFSYLCLARYLKNRRKIRKSYFSPIFAFSASCDQPFLRKASTSCLWGMVFFVVCFIIHACPGVWRCCLCFLLRFHSRCDELNCLWQRIYTRWHSRSWSVVIPCEWDFVLRLVHSVSRRIMGYNERQYFRGVLLIIGLVQDALFAQIRICYVSFYWYCRLAECG